MKYTKEEKKLRKAISREILAGPYVPERFEVLMAVAGGGFVGGAAVTVMVALRYELANRWANRETSLENADENFPAPVGGVAQ